MSTRFNPHSFMLTKQSKIVYHDKPYSFEIDFGRLITFNGKKETFETKCPFLLNEVRPGVKIVDQCTV